jgi:hypothetical protein
MTDNGNITPKKPEQGFYYIKNWKKFQHYKRRDPPWVKLHRNILSSTDWVGWSDTSRSLAIVLMLIASQHEGQIPRDRNYIKRVGSLSKLPNLKPLIDCGFLVDSLAECYQDASKTLAPRKQLARAYVSASVSASSEMTKEESKEEISLTSKSGGSDFVFEAGVIRLTEKHLSQWQASFTDINVRAELEPLAEWAAKQQNWFMAVAGALAKKNREAIDRKRAITVGVQAGTAKPGRYFSV